MLLTTACCAALTGLLIDNVFHTGSDVYNSTENSYWSTQETSLTPACIVRPSSALDVSHFISIAANLSDCQFAIKSQGHAPGPGFANIDGGVTLDITSLNSTTISNDLSIASVGPGSSWLEVYRTLNPFNKTVAGGRNGAVGVGGLTLGGGISYYSPQVGWTCDTVVNFEVVLASSEIVNANATSNPDLYRALKGGGNNFGVVTRIDYQTVDIVPLLGGLLFNSGKYTYEVLGAFNNIASASDYDIHASIVTSLIFNSTSKAWSIVTLPTYTLPETQPAVYHEMFSIPNITSLTSVKIQNISTLSAEPPYPVKYELFYTSTYAAVAQGNLLNQLFDVCNTTLQGFEFASPISWSLAFEPLPVAFLKHGNTTNALGFNGSPAENSIIMLMSVSWTDGSLGDTPHTFGVSLLAKMDEVAARMGMLRDFRYLNYGDASQDVLHSYGEDAWQFLKNVSEKYDPEGIFQRSVPGGFKIG